MDCTQKYPEALEVFNIIQKEINNNFDFQIIGVRCYICNELGHISTDCYDFQKIEGNIAHLIRKPKRTLTEDSFRSSTTSNNSIELFHKLEEIGIKEEHKAIPAMD